MLFRIHADRGGHDNGLVYLRYASFCQRRELMFYDLGKTTKGKEKKVSFITIFIIWNDCIV